MSLRGVGKALYRTPHQLFGQKSAEDVIYKQWEHDVKTAIAGLEYLKSEDAKWKNFWAKAITNFVMVIEIFRDLHSELETVKSRSAKDNNDKTVDKNEDFSSITIHELEQSVKLAKIIYDKVTRLSDDSSDIFVSRCNEMIKTLKHVEKLITKRNHKKIDYDMQVKKLESSLRGTTATEKEKSKVEINQQKLTENEIIYKDLNDKIQLIIPQVLSNFSEFLNKLTLKLYFSNSDILTFVQKNISKFSRVHGLASDSSLLSFSEIIHDFNIMNSQAQSKLQELSLLKDFKIMREKNIGEKTKGHINNVAGTVVDSTVNFTSTLYTKASKPNQNLSVSLSSFKIDNPVKPYDKSGIFGTALDPIEVIKQTNFANELSELDFNSLSLDTPLSDPDYDINEKEDTPSLTETTTSAANDNWMKPLKNSTLNKSTSSPPPSSSNYDTSFDTTQDSSIDNKYIANTRVSSLNLSEKTETYKYVNVTIDNITKQISLIVSNPDINTAPVVTTKGKIHYPDSEVSKYIIARSSITANAFATYST
jgi:hypothetical protein